MAFLIPAIQNLLKDKALERRQPKRSQQGASDVRAIIISPTRELAEQIAVEARKLCDGTNVRVQTAVGGTGKKFALKAMNIYGCHLLIGTPGRLQDILSDPSSGVSAPNLHTLVLDEADRLLDQGFSQAISDIQRLLPDRRKVDRQTLLYSATVPDEVMSMVDQTLKPRYKFIRTVKQGELPTHEKVPQKVVITAGIQNMLPALLELCRREIAAAMDPSNAGASPFKAIVYFGSTANVSLAASTFRNLQKLRGPNAGGNSLRSTKIIEIHSKLSQSVRTYSSDMFRNSRSAILFSSDVTARGMDFPGVTHVIQLGIPSTTEQYVHRIGRTARGNNTGESWIILGDFEYGEASQRLRGLPIHRDDSLVTANVDMANELQLPASAAEILTQISEAILPVEREKKVMAYLANLGIYAGFRNKRRLVGALNDWVRYGWGWETPPSISPALVQKMGYGGVSGLNIGRKDYGFQEGGTAAPGEGNGFSKGSYHRRDSPRDGRQFGNRGSGGYSSRGSFSREDREIGNGGNGRSGNRGGFSGSSEFRNRGRGAQSSGGRSYRQKPNAERASW
jgi:ATP-dependent RNA helicase MSS116